MMRDCADKGRINRSTKSSRFAHDGICTNGHAITGSNAMSYRYKGREYVKCRTCHYLRLKAGAGGKTRDWLEFAKSGGEGRRKKLLEAKRENQ